MLILTHSIPIYRAVSLQIPFLHLQVSTLQSVEHCITVGVQFVFRLLPLDDSIVNLVEHPVVDGYGTREERVSHVCMAERFCSSFEVLQQKTATFRMVNYEDDFAYLQDCQHLLDPFTLCWHDNVRLIVQVLFAKDKHFKGGEVSMCKFEDIIR